MNVKMRAEKTLWWLRDDTGIRHTYLLSASIVRTHNAHGVQFIFLFFNLAIYW